jgi:hypothetical protein
MLVIGGFVAWLAFFLMDRYWYHPLLLGAVKHALKLEVELERDVPGIKLTSAISEASPIDIRIRKRKWTLHSSHKMPIFYGLIAGVLVALFIVILSGLGPDEAHSSTTPTPTTATHPQGNQP